MESLKERILLGLFVIILLSSFSFAISENNIRIIKAEYLDNNHSLISDITQEVNNLDSNYKIINNNEYIRVKFKENLSSNDYIIINSKSNKSSIIKIYLDNKPEIIGRIDNLSEDKKYFGYLYGIGNNTSDTFDLKVISQYGVEINQINNSYKPKVENNLEVSNISNATKIEEVFVIKELNPKYSTFSFDDIWHRNSEVQIKIQTFGNNDTKYFPKDIVFKYNIQGITFKETKKQNNTDIIATFLVAGYTDLGNKIINVTIKDERTVEYELKFSVGDEEIVKDINQEDSKNYKILFWVFIGLGVCIFLTGIFMLITGRK